MNDVKINNVITLKKLSNLVILKALKCWEKLCEAFKNTQKH